MSYQDFKVTIVPEAPFLTPIMADTLWGHVVCRLAEEGDVREWVDLQNPEPPLILSDAFPEGCLPAPVMALPAAFRRADAGIASLTRRAMKSELLPDELVSMLLASPDDMEQVLMAVVQEAAQARRCPLTFTLDPGCHPKDCPTLSPQSVSLEDKRNCTRIRQASGTRPLVHPSRHLAIDRRNLTALEGQLFDQSDQWLAGSWVLWARTTLDEQELRRVFTVVGECGYGARSAVGKGHFTVASINTGLSPVPPAATPRYFMTLSSSLPATADWAGRALRYQLRVKRGKRYQASEFIKRPLAMFRAGSVFAAERTAPFVGQLVGEVHTTAPEVVECGLAYPVWF